MKVKQLREMVEQLSHLDGEQEIDVEGYIDHGRGSLKLIEGYFDLEQRKEDEEWMEDYLDQNKEDILDDCEEEGIEDSDKYIKDVMDKVGEEFVIRVGGEEDEDYCG